MSNEKARERFLQLLHSSAMEGSLVKLTLARPCAGQGDLRNLFVRPVTLRKGPHLSLVWRHETRDVTKNLAILEGLTQLGEMLGTVFMDAHLFTEQTTAELRCGAEGHDKLTLKASSATAPKVQAGHDRAKTHAIDAKAGWLQRLGVTNEHGAPRAEMSSKLRQIQKYAELLGHLLEEAGLGQPVAGAEQAPFGVVDMGCGKGYLTFAVAQMLGARAKVAGVEVRPELAQKCNTIAAECGLANLSFRAGTIQEAELGSPEVVIALHACDTATDDALARGIASGAKLLIVSPCCHKELRPQLVPPGVLAGALRHGILRERQAEFVTDALRAELLEWAGYDTKVFEFISTEHTAKNLMIAAIKRRPAGDEAAARRVLALAAHYGITQQALAHHLGLELKTS